uniref:Uncharacterized protein n=1 Tax=Aegilops tauschii subsp. strangulata TaxID=200361 RepID=A0A453E7E9_AEGTS
MGRLDPSDCKFSENVPVFLGHRDANVRKHSVMHTSCQRPRGLFCFCFCF